MKIYYRIRQLSLLISATSLIALYPSLTHAQEREKFKLEEVIVTAQKREQSLQDTPISITALNEAMLAVQGVTDTDSFANLVPNLHIKQSPGSAATFGIRGVSNNFAQNAGFEPSVGLYVDGMYVGKGYGSIFDLGDVERLEVLRGPQGTLYGRNTIGGAINIISKRPSGEWGGELKLGLGNENLTSAKVGLDFPTLGTAGEGLGALALRTSYFNRQRDGFTDNVQQDFAAGSQPIGNFDRFGDVEREGVRVVADWQIRDAVKVSYDFNQSEVDDVPRLFQMRRVNSAHPAAPAGLEDYIPDGYPSKGSSNIEPFIRTDIKSHSLVMSWNINDNIEFKSLTGMRDTQLDESVDIDGTNLILFESIRKFDGEQKSQEFQLIGKSASINYVLGYYYFEEELEDLSSNRFAPAFIFQTAAYVDNKNQAVFAQLDWVPESHEALTLSLGARHTKEEKNMARTIRVSFNPADFVLTDPVPNITNPEIDFSNTSVMFSPSYQLTEDINIYAKYSEGFRSGGYDGSTTNPVAATIPFDSEELTSYELGLKSHLLDSKLELNVAAFYMDYDEIQLTSFNGTVSATLNAGQAYLQGLELELVYLVSPDFKVDLSYSYLDTGFDEFDMGGAIGDVSNIANVINAPRNTVNLALSYDIHSFSFGTLTFHTNYNYSAEAQASSIRPDGLPADAKLEERDLLDLRLTLSDVDVGNDMFMDLSLWVMNATDEVYADSGIEFPDRFLLGTVGPPRTFGIEATLQF